MAEEILNSAQDDQVQLDGEAPKELGTLGESEYIISQRREIQGSWEFIAASQFLVLFQDSFGLKSFNTRVRN